MGGDLGECGVLWGVWGILGVDLGRIWDHGEGLGFLGSGFGIRGFWGQDLGFGVFGGDLGFGGRFGGNVGLFSGWVLGSYPPRPLCCPTGEALLSTLGSVAATPFGVGLLTHMLRCGAAPAQLACATALPLLARYCPMETP